MDIRIERQPRRIVHAIPPPGTGQSATARASSESHGPQSHQLFDANGDGAIENWSIAHGGDSFANFDPPPSGAPASDPKPHNGSGTVDPAPARVRGGDHASGAGTPAAVHHARGAYQRDGMGSSRAASTPAPATTGSRPPAPPVSQPAAATPRPTAR
jgi:hypothetical protein